MKTQNLFMSSADDTELFGQHLGRHLKGGEIIELSSDLGGGKTTLTRGIARGAGSSDVVGSPTFTLSKIYKTQKFDIHHFDFYRLNEVGIIEHEIRDLITDTTTVLVIEWAKLIQDVLPDNRVTINIKNVGENARMLTYTFPDDLSYLMKK